MFDFDTLSPKYHPNNPDYPKHLKHLYETRLRAMSAVMEKAIDLICIENGIDEESESDTATAVMLLNAMKDYFEEF